jgi:hypothetical protein
MGTRLYEVFVAAGVASPQMCTDALIGAGDQWIRRFAAAFGAGILRSLLPVILEQGIATESGLGLDTFDERYIAEVVGRGSVVQWIPFVGAWAGRMPDKRMQRPCQEVGRAGSPAVRPACYPHTDRGYRAVAPADSVS